MGSGTKNPHRVSLRKVGHILLMTKRSQGYTHRIVKNKPIFSDWETLFFFHVALSANPRFVRAFNVRETARGASLHDADIYMHARATGKKNRIRFGWAERR